jgi:hypothetical protein
VRFKKVSKHLAIETWNPDDRLQAANGQQHEGKQDSGLQLRNLEAVTKGVSYGGEHVSNGASSSLGLSRLGFGHFDTLWPRGFGWNQLTGAAFGFDFCFG